MDNALDACEEAEVAPVISITVKPGSVTIQDNGSGIKTSTIKSILDYRHPGIEPRGVRSALPAARKAMR